jgi:hypothetical protein
MRLQMSEIFKIDRCFVRVELKLNFVKFPHAVSLTKGKKGVNSTYSVKIESICERTCHYSEARSPVRDSKRRPRKSKAAANHKIEFSIFFGRFDFFFKAGSHDD